MAEKIEWGGGPPGPWYAVGCWIEHPDDDTPDIAMLVREQGDMERSRDEIARLGRAIAQVPAMVAWLRATAETRCGCPCCGSAADDARGILAAIDGGEDV